MSTQVWVLVTDLSCHQVHFPRPGNDPCVMYLSIWSIARTFFLKPILVSFWLAKNKSVGNTILIDWRVVDIAWSPTNQRPGIQNTFRLQFTFLNCTCAAPILWYLDKIMSNHQISKEKDENCMANICKHPKKFQNRILIQTREGNYLVYLYLLAFGSFSELIMILFWIKFSFRRVWLSMK